MLNTSSILAPSLCWDGATTASLRPGKRRILVQNESEAWQQLSQYGADAEFYATQTIIRRRHKVGGKTVEVPKRPRREPPPNRLLEIHGLAGSIGEQLGLAWTAEQDVQRFVATRERRIPEHQRLIQRALAELSAHYLLGVSHSLGNFVLRLLLLNPAALASLSAKKSGYSRADGFPAGSDMRGTWPTLNLEMVEKLQGASHASGNRFMVQAVDRVAGLHASGPFKALDDRRGLDYHRRRPQSVPHVSPRGDVIERHTGYRQFSMPAPALEPEADADQVHGIVVDALDLVRLNMRDIRRLVPKIIRAEGITYIL